MATTSTAIPGKLYKLTAPHRAGRNYHAFFHRAPGDRMDTVRTVGIPASTTTIVPSGSFSKFAHVDSTNDSILIYSSNKPLNTPMACSGSYSISYTAGNMVQVPEDGVCMCLDTSAARLKSFYAQQTVMVSFLYNETVLETTLGFWQNNFILIQDGGR